MAVNNRKSDELLGLLRSKLGRQIESSEISLGDVVVYISKSSANDFFNIAKIDSDLDFDLLVSITAVDWMDAKNDRFEMVYHLLSLKNGFRLRIKVPVSEMDPKIDSITHLWAGANFMEREVWDMYGIKFEGHPNLQRILMYDEFVGHPLRKDYPVQGKQPRIPLRHPEVRNTAVDMKRPNLVKINPRKATDGRANP